MDGTHLHGKVAIITGASSGIGAETARVLASAGMKVALAARREDRLHALAEELRAQGAHVLTVPTDVTCRERVNHLAHATREAFGPIDALINNAGIMPLSFMKNLDVEGWERMIDVNIKGVLYGVAAVLDEMRHRRSGHIINVSSVAGRRHIPGGAVYCATKFAVNAITEGLRQEISPFEGVRFTSIEPGATSTELFHHITDEEVLNYYRGRNLRGLDSVDIANGILYALQQPAHVDVAELLIMPTAQG